jgi:hypothetical protein
MTNKTDFFDLMLTCAEVCEALGQAMRGKKEDDLSQSVREAMDRLTTWVKPVMYGLDSTLTMPLSAEP